MSNKKDLQLKVAEALQSDVGRNIIRIDTKARDALNRVEENMNN